MIVNNAGRGTVSRDSNHAADIILVTVSCSHEIRGSQQCNHL